MRKNIIIALAALMTLAVSCKKNNIEKTDNAGTDPNPAVVLEQSPDITRIIKFNNDVKLRRENPELKTREVITLDEAKDNIADLFNAVYGEPTEYYGETEHAEFSVTLPVDADGNVLLDDAAAAYEEAVELARESYHASTLENKGYICMSATVEQQRGGTAEVKLNGVFGKKTAAPTVVSHGIYNPDEWWSYTAGDISIDCDPDYAIGADEVLMEDLKFYYNLNEEIDVPEGYRATVIRGRVIDFIGNAFEDHPLFYREGMEADSTCVNGSDMTTFYNNSIEVIPTLLQGIATNPAAYAEPYQIVDLSIDGRRDITIDDRIPYITHYYKITYGRIGYVQELNIGLEEL